MFSILFTLLIWPTHVNSTICAAVKEKDVNTTSALKSNYDLEVIVKTAAYNFEDLQKFRTLYARINDFSVYTRHPFRIGIRLREEILQYNDLLVGDYEDTYYNLTTKMMTNFQWAARFCRNERPGFLFLDDDYGFHPKNLRCFLARLEADWRDRMVVRLKWNKPPTVRYGNDARTDKWALSKREMPCPAFHHTLEKLTISMHFTRSIPIDDVWLGLVMTKLDLRFQYRAGSHFDWEAGPYTADVRYA
ncbi:unnamed protein product [Dibothriocephalus latus]|uniref:Hexosyltransferase n=1 Tax=Dibothriocephalus latus TaxID=60516 RepID=A0A3P7KUM8_DIBLA|nr:unnamed protein product [Dibothriocephalus latus]